MFAPHVQTNLQPKVQPFCRARDAVKYLLKKNGRYFYHRRVPGEVQEYDPRPYVRIALRTDSEKDAVRRIVAQNDKLEAYWQSLIDTAQRHSDVLYQNLVKRAKLFGFSYLPAPKVATVPLEDIIERVRHVTVHDNNQYHAEAVLGAHAAPKITLSVALTKFWLLARDKTVHKSPNQLRKWKTPRKRAIDNLIGCIGDKDITKITRDDMLKFRDEWIDRIETDKLVKNSANKNFSQIKVIIDTVNKNLKLGINVSHIFGELSLGEDDRGTRPPFETDWLLEKLLLKENFRDIDAQAMWALFAFAETGAGLAEQTSLMPEDIRLDTDIPHIDIKRRAGKSSKTAFRPRQIPLVGFALDAFKACPQGFTDYIDNPDYLANILGGHLREKGLFPSEEHTLYSLRHSFQDRLIDADVPERVQAELMGHSVRVALGRERYGKGPTLAKKLEWMQKIQLKPA